MMIDWFRGAISFTHKPIPHGRVISIDQDGSVQWTSAKSTQVRDSWETNLNISSVLTDIDGGSPFTNLLGKKRSLVEVSNMLSENKKLPFYFRKKLTDDYPIRLTNAILQTIDEKDFYDLDGLCNYEFFEPTLEFTPYDGFAKTLYIDGNLSKFLQGHNVFGSCNLNRLLSLSFDKIINSLADHFHGHDLQVKAAQKLIHEGEYLVKMLDINDLYDCGNDSNVEAWLHAAEMRARSRSGRATRDKGTVYLAKSSKRHAFKFYNKLREINASKKHQLPNELQGLGLESFVTGKLRAELRIFGKELQERHGITHGKHIDEAVIQTLFNDYLKRITMSANVTLFDEALLKLPRGVQGTYQLWRQGATMIDVLPRRTFYRHRKILVEHGIDILSNRPDPDISNVVPMIRIIEAQPVAIPAWAYEKGLIAC